MSASAKFLGIDKLDIEDGLALVEEIWASIVADVETFPQRRHGGEQLIRRVADDDAYPSDVIR